jgi:DUF2924 family protein
MMGAGTKAMSQPDNSHVEQEIAALCDLDHAALKERWRALRGGEPPRKLSRQFLLRALAYYMQEQAFGGLSPAVRQRLQRLAVELKATGRITSTGKQSPIKPGTRLIREWQGSTHEVTVLEEGFQWNEETYRSLSAIARAITGTRWNGHLFFGLRPRGRAAAASNKNGDEDSPIRAVTGAVIHRKRANGGHH